MAPYASIGEKTRLTNWVSPACQADPAGRQTSRGADNRGQLAAHFNSLDKPHLTNWVSPGCQADQAGQVPATSAMYVARATSATSACPPRSPCTTFAAHP